MKILKIYRLITVLALYPFFGVAQSSFTSEPLGPEVNSSYHEIDPVVSSDGKTLFFTRVNHPENKYGGKDSEDIWVSHRVNGSWSPAMRIVELNIGRYNSVLSISEDGATILLNGIYNQNGNIWKERGLSVSIKESGKWGAPKKLKIKRFSRRNKGLKSAASMSADGQYLVFSFSTSHNSKKADLFISRRKKTNWSRPVPIRKLNTRFNEESPFLSGDGKTMYFTSDRERKGMFDIYTSTRAAVLP